MRTRFARVAAPVLLIISAAAVACQPGTGGGSEAPAPESQALASQAPASDAAPAPSATDDGNY